MINGTDAFNVSILGPWSKRLPKSQKDSMLRRECHFIFDDNLHACGNR